MFLRLNGTLGADGGVTKAATLLQDRKLISYSRGDITIIDIDRSGLDAVSCERYATDNLAYSLTMTH